MEWTLEEEQAFTKLEEAGPMSRLEAIRALARAGGSLDKALAAVARSNQLAGRVPYVLQNWEARKVRLAKKGV